MKPVLSLFVVVLLVSLVLSDAAWSRDAADSVANMDAESPEVAALYMHHHKKINCRKECARRCRKASRKKICHRACGTCCRRCHCVPPGTYGNKEACPCYARLRTHGNRLKCP